MPKRTIILVFTLIIAGCSVSKRGKVNADNTVKEFLNLKERMLTLNVKENDFNISKAEVEILSNGKQQKLLASMKYRNNGIYLLSIRNRSGIEAARIYITSDTLMINDRIDKKVYCGSTENLSEKYGFSATALPLLMGDFLLDVKTGSDKISCKNNKGEINSYLQNKKISYVIDCEIAKVTSAIISDEDKNTGIELKFSNFRMDKKHIFPGIIEIEDLTNQTKIKIDIIIIEFDTSDRIEFIPGKNYEKIMMK